MAGTNYVIRIWKFRLQRQRAGAWINLPFDRGQAPLVRKHAAIREGDADVRLRILRGGLVRNAFAIFEILPFGDREANPERIDRGDRGERWRSSCSHQGANLSGGNSGKAVHRRINFGVIQINLRRLDVGFCRIYRGLRSVLAGLGVVQLLAAYRVFGGQWSVACQIVLGLLELRFGLRQLAVGLGEGCHVGPRINRVKQFSGADQRAILVILRLQKTGDPGLDLNFPGASRLPDGFDIDRQIPLDCFCHSDLRRRHGGLRRLRVARSENEKRRQQQTRFSKG